MRPERLRWCPLLLAAMAWPALADIKVDIHGVEGAERQNVEVRLSVMRYRDSKDLDEDIVRRLCNRIEGEVKSALRPFGYYEPTVAYDCPQSGKDWQVAIAIKPGEPVRVRSLRIEIQGPGSMDPVFDNVKVDKQRLLREGMRLNHGAYEDLKGQMMRIAEGSGYREARLLTSEMDVDPKEHEAGIALVLDTGPRYSFGAVDIEQNSIRPSLMRRFLRFREGEPYSATQLLYTQFALDDSLYFSQVEVDAGDPDPDTLTVPVSIRADKSRPTFSIGGGYATDTGVRGTFGWTDSRVNDRGHRFRVEVKASTRTRQVDSRYDIPIGDPALERFSIEGQNTYDEPSDIKTSTTTLTPSVTRAHGRWQTVTSLAATRTTTDEGANKKTSNLLVPGYVFASVPKDYLGQVLFSRAFYAELLGSHTALGSDSNFLRLSMQSEHTFDLDFAWHLLLRGQAGAAFVNRIGDLPGIYRFFAGGDRSVRGFAYNTLSPKELVTESDGTTRLQGVGGRYLLVGSAEIVRDLPRNWAVATFFDFGNAFNDVHDKLESGVGVGVRYRLTGVSIGVDVARPLSTPDHKLRLHLNITPKL